MIVCVFDKFLSTTTQLLRQTTPRRLKEILQVLTRNMPLVLADEQLLTVSCDAAAESFNCDYFLLKVARAEFLAAVEWNKVSEGCRQSHQRLCVELLIRQLFDTDYRVANATAAVLET